MRADLVDAIQVPFWAGIRPNEKGQPLRVSVCAFDFETVRGVPYCLAWQDNRGADVYGVHAKTALGRIVSLIRRDMNTHDRPVVLAFAHVLRYDLGVIVYPHLQTWTPITARQGILDLSFGDTRAELEYYFGRVTFARLRIGQRVALIVDTFRYFSMSLDRAAEAVGVPLRKMEKPAGLGERRIPLAELRDYALQDVRIAHALGERIVDWHRRRDLRPSVSVPQLALRTLCHGFVKRRWQETPPNIRRAALLAYHAGRNGLYVAPGWRRVKLLDMTSAFPWAMTRLPSFSEGRWRRVLTAESPWGFYWLYRGRVAQRPYPILFSHDFKPLPDGPIREPVYVTGMELQAALASGLLREAGVVGHVWEPTSTDRPLRDFVREMFRRRKAAVSPENKAYYKLMMNSLYGKFVSRVEAVTVAGKDVRAGAAFYPVAASWITGLVRVHLWTMERAAGAYHSATDGVMVPPDFPWHSSTRLGGWKVDAEGWALILRNKFYFVFSDEGRLLKCALHGFDGAVTDALDMLRTGRQSYHVDRLRGWLESAARGVRPFVPEHRVFRVTCPMTGFWPPPLPLVDVPAGHGWRSVVFSHAEQRGEHDHATTESNRRDTSNADGVRLQVGPV